ncbi:uncharacterized protein LOC132705528 [Cylas formicarius]|uniref:uncharacterized protein LOC132705528 n=1 Tax=Cylas formicarius TaxID=197179 RepID=UPI0029584AFD|nr:uncharacterized protein LOC132705528 [Cylas formicarius]
MTPLQTIYVLCTILYTSCYIQCYDEPQNWNEPTYYIQHVQTGWYISDNGGLVTSQNQAARFRFEHNGRLSGVQFINYKTGNALDIRGGCHGNRISMYRPNSNARNQRFILSADGTIGTGCDSDRVLALTNNQDELIVLKKGVRRFEETLFRRPFAGYLNS